jgi:hypothetical protein
LSLFHLAGEERDEAVLVDVQPRPKRSLGRGSLRSGRRRGDDNQKACASSFKELPPITKLDG